MSKRTLYTFCLFALSLFCAVYFIASSQYSWAIVLGASAAYWGLCYIYS